MLLRRASLTSPSSSTGVLSRPNLTVDRNFEGELILSFILDIIEGLWMQFAVSTVQDFDMGFVKYRAVKSETIWGHRVVRCSNLVPLLLCCNEYVL